MARYIVTNGSYFKPFTYDELAKPLEQATEAHNATADAYDQMSMEASALEEYLKKEPEDSRARRMYDTYMNQLTSLQDELWNNGYSAAARRGLGLARAGYATNITRLQKAISDRQARSKEYWEIAHKNPDMVMGFDPGLGSIDDYLDNDNYGMDYYTYSGKDFTEAIGTNAKARVSEMMRDPKYANDVPGYITRFLTKGATSEEVQAAGNIVDKVLAGEIDRSQLIDNESIEGILANVLLDGLDSTGAITGANGNISDKQYRRLVEFGKLGLGRAVGETTPTDLNDKVWDFNKQVALLNHQHKLNTLEQQQQPVMNMGSTIELTSPGYNDLVKYTEKQDRNYRDESGNAKPIAVTINGVKTEVTNPYQMADLLYETDARKSIREKTNGIDIALGNGEKQETTVNGHKYFTDKISQKDADRLGLNKDTAIGIYEDLGNGNKRLIDSYTSYATKGYEQLNNRIPKVTAAGDVKVEDYAISPKQQAELRKKYNYPATASWSDFYNFVTAAEKQGTFSESTLAGSDLPHTAYAVPALASAFEHQMNNAQTAAGKRGIEKGGKYAVYEVGEGGMAVSDKGITDMATIFGTTSDGRTIDYSSMKNIKMLLEDFDGNRPRIRFQSAHQPGKTYIVDASMFGPLVYNELNDKSGIISMLLLPVNNAKDVMNMSDKESQELGNLIYSTLHEANSNLSLPYRINVNEDGTQTARAATAKEILLNERDRNNLRKAVESEFVNPILENIRKAISIWHEQYRGNSNSKAE